MPAWQVHAHEYRAQLSKATWLGMMRDKFWSTFSHCTQQELLEVRGQGSWQQAWGGSRAAFGGLWEGRCAQGSCRCAEPPLAAIPGRISTAEVCILRSASRGVLRLGPPCTVTLP